ncbi:cytochrome c [Oscillochloris sp. ZM17-4]|uniref:c-type cytochrome n=1 Tax=Oscillochloris sp. ZM17-4 TaxID=2866714 RepID=UPI001C72BDA3|nr:cytochrome c [Oscillochloris sp. ZM17-4]MBX0327356.1 cytochrome c [Oscillochloris sp. ZM17-4]
MQTLRSRRFATLARLVRYGWVGLFALLLAACHTDMYSQPKFQTYEPSSFFADGRSSRPNVPGTVAVGQVQTDTYLYTGMIDGQLGDVMPFPVTADLLARGQQQFTIYCSVCHGVAGFGQSMVAERGAIVPANFHQQRLLDAPIGHFFDVITNGVYRGDPNNGGYQSMFSYASRVKPEDRWAIAAYIRALQLSQNATVDDVPPEARAQLGR